MFKKIFISLITFSFFSIITIGSIQAQEANSYYFGLSGLIVMENYDGDKTEDKFIGNVNADFDDTWGLQIHGGYILNEYASAELRFEYIGTSDADLGYNYESEMDVMDLTVNIKGKLPIKEFFVPYTVFGIGLMNSYEEISAGNTSKKSDWGPCSRFGIGLDFPVHSKFSFGLELAYVIGLGNIDHIEYSTIGLGATYRF